MAVCRSPSVTWGNSSTPLWMRKHLKPATPAWIMGWSSSCGEASFVCVCFGHNSAQSGWEMCSFCPSCSSLPDCQESHRPRRLCPQNTSLSPPAACHENCQGWWLEGCYFCCRERKTKIAAGDFQSNFSKLSSASFVKSIMRLRLFYMATTIWAEMIKKIPLFLRLVLDIW